MFGYITINKSELKFKEYDMYRSYYCGFCKTLKENYGWSGQLTLSYDMTFLILLLTGLYEPETKENMCRCAPHPFSKHSEMVNEYTQYAAEMNILLSYHKCMDDWMDDKKYSRYGFSKLLMSKYKKIQAKHKEKEKNMMELFYQIHACEKRKEQDIDLVSGYFGKLMAEIMAIRKDEWEENLRKIGFYLGKFIYCMDAYEDLENDLKNESYNPLLIYYQKEDFEEKSKQILFMMMAECSKEFEKLPILENVEILRNILYSGVWSRYELVRAKRQSRISSYKR